MIRAKALDAPQGRIPPPPFLAGGAAARVLAALPWSRAVGGCVRDAIAGLPVHDIDIAAPLPPEEIRAGLTRAGLAVHDTGLAHGTLTAVAAGEAIEVTALRRDVTTDGRHATVAWTTEWQEDAARRDFTINAMSCDADGRLWDYFGGREDLAAGRVAFVGDAATRLAEDYLRALRFFRFWARYGRGQPDAAALAAIRHAVPGIRARIASERVWMAVKRLLAAPDPVGALALMRDGGLLRALLPEAEDFTALGRLVARRAPADALLRLAALIRTPGAVAPLAQRLRLSGAEAQLLGWLLATPPPSGPSLDRFLAEAGSQERAQFLLWLAEARDGHDRQPQRAALAQRPVPVFPLQGRDGLALGAAPGPALGAALKAVEAWWLEAGCPPDRDAVLAELGRRLSAP